MTDAKIEKRFIYEGFGFPLVLRNVPMVRVRGVWTPKLDYNRLARAMAHVLALKPSRLTGNEIHFIRHYFDMTLDQFGKRFDVSHPAVLKWEAAGDRATASKWPIEKDIRLFVLDRLHVRANEFKDAYARLGEGAKTGTKPIEMDVAVAA